VAIGQQCPTLCQNRKAPRVAEQAHASKSEVLSVGNAEFGESVSGSSPCQEPRVNVSEVDVFNQAALPKHFALEFFAGTARIFSALRKERIPCFPIDIALFRSHNVLDPPITHTLLNWTSSGRISLVWLGMPCTTFSRARRDDGVGPMPLHDDNHLWGLHIKPADFRKLSDGNHLFRFTMKVLHLCEQHRVPYVLENLIGLENASPSKVCYTIFSSFLRPGFLLLWRSIEEAYQTFVQLY
jgi:hypothetical protein